MFVNILVIDPNAAFATMIQQVLEETRRFKVVSVATPQEAVALVSRQPFDLAIIDTDLAEVPFDQLIKVVRQYRPALAVMAMPPFGVDNLPAFDSLDIQGLLPKPFYIPDLESIVDDALTKPVNGIVPPARHKPVPLPAEPMPSAQSALVSAPAAKPAPKRQAVAPPAWIDDVGRAAQYLTGLTLESSAEAALLMRGRNLLAYAGQFASEQANELAAVVAENWAADSGGGQGAQLKFIRLSNSFDYLVYSSVVAEDVVLSLVFQTETPLGMIRRQAKKATDALFTANNSAPSHSTPPFVETDEIHPAGDPTMRPAQTPLAGERSIPVEAKAPAPSLPTPKQPAATPPAPGVPLQPAPFPDVRRTPHGLYALSYTFLFLPRIPGTKLEGDIKSRLEEWIGFLALARDWRITSLDVAATYIEVSIDCSPAEAPERVIKAIMQTTAEKIMAEFPRIAAEHSKRAASFWAPGYYAVAPGRRLSADEIARFIAYERKEQGL